MRLALFVHTCVWHMCVAPSFAHVRAPLCSHMCVARRYSATNSLELPSAHSTVTISVVKSNDVSSADPQPATISASPKSVVLTIATVDSDTHQLASCPWQPVLLIVHSDLYNGGEGFGEHVFW